MTLISLLSGSHVLENSDRIMVAMEIPLNLSPDISRRRQSISPRRIAVGLPTTPFKSSFSFSQVRASNKQVEPSSNNSGRAFTSQEDLGYLWKLGAGSVIGAAAIKYGSVLFPSITRPNIVEALLYIFLPVILAVLLLIRQSRIE